MAGLALAAGCSHQDFPRPITSNPISDAMYARRSKQSVDQAKQEERMNKLAKALADWNQRAAQQADDYVVGPADTLDIAIFALESPDETTHLKRTVNSDGYVSLPWTEKMRANGLSTRQLEEQIKDAYRDRYIKNPQVTVEVSEYRSVAVILTGAVKLPGVYYLTRNKSSVLEVLAKAGGLTDTASDDLMIISAGEESAGSATNAVTAFSNLVEQAEGEGMGPALTAAAEGRQIIHVDLEELIGAGDLRLNAMVSAGDIVTVRSLAQQYVYVLGYVQRPGAFEMKTSQQVDALHAVAMAGGLSPTARAENSFLIRETEEGQQVIAIDLVRVARGVRPTFYMEPGDTLIVGSGAIAKLSEFVRPSASAGVSYTPLP